MKYIITTSLHIILFILLIFSPTHSQLTSIYDIQFTNDSSGDSPMNGQNVTIRGTVTGAFKDGFFVSDAVGPWNSIYIWTKWKSPTLGQEVQLSGLVFEYDGLTEIKDLTDYQVLSDSNMIEAAPVSAIEASTEQYESVLIEVNDVAIISQEEYGEWIIQDSTGTIRIDDLNDYVYFPTVGDSLESIRGILVYFFGDYKIEPRFTNDFIGDIIPHYALKGNIVTMNDNFDVLPEAYLEILGDQIIGISTSPPEILIIDVQGYIFPGFIDAHNHPQWNVLDYIPFSQRFSNRYQWRNSGLYQQVKSQRNNILNYNGDKAQLSNIVKLSEIRALCSGTTYIQGGGNSSVTRQGIGIKNAERFPSRTKNAVDPLDKSLEWWQNINNEYWNRYMIHLSEGIDQLSLNEFEDWKNHNGLDECTTIIHGTALTRNEFEEMADSGAHLVWSPKSNWNLYGNTTDIPTALNAGVNVSLSPDWSLSGERNILDEIKFANRINKAIWSDAITPKQFASFVTRNAADALGMQERIGIIEVGYQADLAVIPQLSSDPYETLLESEVKDIMLTIVNGKPLYGDPEMISLFPFVDEVETISIKGVEKNISIRVDSPVIPESDKLLSEIVNELVIAYDSSIPKACRFLGYTFPEYDWEFKETKIINDLYSIDAVDENIIWASGLNGKIITTSDSGNNWDIISANIDSMHYTVIDAIDSTNLLIAGFVESINNIEVKIYRSHDSGRTWNNVYHEQSGKINDITMFDELTGIAIGNPVEGVWRVLKTDDGGATWIQMDSAPLQSNNETGFIGCVFWLDDQTGWFGSNGSILYSTTNGGENWDKINISGIQNINKIAFSDSGYGFLVSDSLFLRTSDYGKNWISIDTPGYRPIDLLNCHKGVFWTSDASSCLYYSQDNGYTWEVSSIPHYRSNDISFFDNSKTHLWVAGHAGSIFQKSLQYPSIIIVNPEESSNLGHNYPNPFSEATTIKYNLSQACNVRIEIYNQIGQKIATILDKNMPLGSHLIQWDGADEQGNRAPTGVYFYQIRAGDLILTKKMVLIK